MSVENHQQKLREHKEHIEGEENGCLIRCFQYGKDDPKGTKGHSHRLNGRIYQEKNESSRYNLDFTSERNKKILEDVFGKAGPRCAGGDPRLRADAWHMGLGDNFCHAQAPWPNVGHHVVPINVIEKVFTKPGELELLLTAKYNVNRGLNIVLLPYEHDFAKVMQLPVHRGSHPTYDEQVETKLNSIRQRLKKAKDPENPDHPELTPDNVPGIASDIESFAKRLRKVLLLGISPSVNEFSFAP